MANVKTISNSRNSVPAGKLALPPKCPFPTTTPACNNYGAICTKGLPKPRDGQKHHQRTSSEGFLVDEQPSWLDDLLNEPETPVKKGAHRRSSSDSFAYLEGSCIYSNNHGLSQVEEYRQKNFPIPSPWVSHEFDQIRDVKHVPYYPEANSFRQPKHRVRDIAKNGSYPGNVPVAKEKVARRVASCASTPTDALTSDVTGIKEQQECNQDLNGSTEQKEGSHSKQSELDPKRAKQQFAQRSRVRKLQYIAELERNVQALQTEGLGFSAELEFLDQQNLILSLENNALKQRLDSLTQEQLIKRLQQEMLEREIVRLRALYQQQQQQSHVTPNHGRSSSRDLDLQFANLSLKHKDPSSVTDSIDSSIHI